MLLNLLPTLREHGVDVSLISLSDRGPPEGDLGGRMNDLGVPTHFLGDRLTTYAGPLIRLMRSRPGPVHSHGYKATILGLAAAHAAGVPLVTTYHAEASAAVKGGTGFAGLRLMSYLWMETFALRKAAQVAAVSGNVREELHRRGVAAERTSVISNGLTVDPSPADPDLINKLSPFEPRVVMVGRLVEGKNAPLAIEALVELRKRIPTAGLVFAGTGPLREELQGHAEGLGVRRSVQFLGYVRNIPALLRQCDCLILPSQSEGAPMTLLEGMACEIPVVASDIPGIREIVSDHEDAILVEPGSSGALAQSLIRLAYSPELRIELTRSALAKYGARHTAQAMAQQYAEWYSSIPGS